MRSKASIQAHPIHPMLIGFPVAFFVGSLLCDLIARSNGSYEWFFAGYVMTAFGVIMGLIAAVPGLIDFTKTVPRGSQAKKDATTHMALNVTVVLLYAISWIIKRDLGAPPAISNILLELVGCGILVYSGWLGWTLVYRHRIGVSGDETSARELRKTA